jgi:hypothetical protein
MRPFGDRDLIAVNRRVNEDQRSDAMRATEMLRKFGIKSCVGGERVGFKVAFAGVAPLFSADGMMRPVYM